MHTKFLRIGVLPVLLGTLLVTILLSEVSFGLLAQEKPDNQEGTRLYFAYGSNLDEEQMAQRCLTASPQSVASIHGYRFVINTRGVASLVESPGDHVEGLLWGISFQDEQLLDLFEGVATGHYSKEELFVEERETGQVVKALVYIATESEPGTPRPGYLEKILKAAEKHGLSEAYVEELRKWL
jgi:gamma-glutamylcyclotransferase